MRHNLDVFCKECSGRLHPNEQREKFSAPIFVIGCPRSGNTLIGAILNKHPKAFILFEANTFSSLYRKWRYLCRQGVDPDKAFMEIMTKYFHKYNEKFRVSPLELKACAQYGPSWGRMLDQYMRLIMSRAKPTAVRWGDKTPHHVGWMESIVESFPNAQFVYVFRDPRSVVASLSKPSFPHTTNDPLINVDVVRQYLEVYEAQKRRVPANRILEIRYEDLVQQPQETVASMCEFLGLDFRDDLLEDAPRSIREIIGWPADKAWNRIKSYPSHLPSRSSRYIEVALGEWIRKLGYDEDVRPFTHVEKMRMLMVSLHNLPFRTTRLAISFFWKRRYGDVPYFMQKFPSLSMVGRWMMRLIGVGGSQ